MNKKIKINAIYLIRRLKGHLPVLILGGISMLVYVICWPILAWLSGKLIPAIGQGNTKLVLIVILQALIVFIIQKIAQYLQDSLLAKPALSLSQDLRSTLFRKLQKTNILLMKNSLLEILHTDLLKMLIELVKLFIKQFRIQHHVYFNY